MRIISFGDLYLDYYFLNKSLIGLDGGKSNANILANLSLYFNTSFIGVCGNDLRGYLSILSLKDLNIDTRNIKRVGDITKTFFINEEGYTSTCPICKRVCTYHGTKIKTEDILPHILDDDLIVVDNLNKVTLDVLTKLENEAFLDLGYLSHDVDIKSLILKIKGRFSIINMNERVYKNINLKYHIDEKKLYNLLKPKILIITKGKKGFTLFYKNKMINEIIDESKEVDVSGAGDAFFAEFIRTYIEKNLSDEMIKLAIIRAKEKSSMIVGKVGARSNIKSLYKIKKVDTCICDKFHIK